MIKIAIAGTDPGARDELSVDTDEKEQITLITETDIATDDRAITTLFLKRSEVIALRALLDTWIVESRPWPTPLP